MEEMILKIMMGALLFFCGLQDVLKKKIYLWSIALGLAAIGVCLLFCKEVSLPDRLGGIAVGLCVIVISKATGGKIGLGDGLLLCATGLGIGFWGNLELFCMALLITAITSIILLIFKLVDRKKSLPFVPFMFAGYLIYMVTSARNGF